MPEHPGISAIVTAYKLRESLFTTLRTLQDCRPPPDEILVHVDANQTACRDAVAARFPGVRVLLSADHVGPGGGRNKLLAAAKNDYVASFDDDSHPLDTDYFARARELIQQHPDVAVFAAEIFLRHLPPKRSYATTALVADFFGGGCIYRREIFLATTGYVSLPVAYAMEEVDLALRLHAMGCKVLRSRYLRVIHDAEEKHHTSPAIVSAWIPNLGLLAFLRYPVCLLWIGILQILRYLFWLITHGHHRGIVTGLARLPAHLWRHRHLRRPVRGRSLVSFFKLRRHPVVISCDPPGSGPAAAISGAPPSRGASPAELSRETATLAGGAQATPGDDAAAPPWEATQPASSHAQSNVIVLAHIGVHQMFQLALAAQETGMLSRLYCSFFDAPGTWGHLFSGRVKGSSFRPLGAERLAPDRVTEIPWPLIARRFKQQLTGRRSDYYRSNSWFDRRVAARLQTAPGAVFVGAEGCALASFRAARARGMRLALDCHGIPSDFLEKQVARAADDLGITCAVAPVSARMKERQAEERERADVVLLCSELQRRCYLDRGLPQSKMRVNPLWVDPTFKCSARARASSPAEPLKVLVVGLATVAKGAPYALQAMELLGDRARLTICGGVDETVRRWAGDRLTKARLIQWLPRSELPEIYASHDLLLFPTLGDSFGFVALEAMASGLPVIASVNAGAPMPDEAWRVPSHDAASIAARLEIYVGDRDRLMADAARAAEFARQFTPERFRQRAAAIFRELLQSGPSRVPASGAIR